MVINMCKEKASESDQCQLGNGQY